MLGRIDRRTAMDRRWCRALASGAAVSCEALESRPFRSRGLGLGALGGAGWGRQAPLPVNGSARDSTVGGGRPEAASRIGPGRKIRPGPSPWSRRL
jgi:hypothetical protein